MSKAKKQEKTGPRNDQKDHAQEQRLEAIRALYDAGSCPSDDDILKQLKIEGNDGRDVDAEYRRLEDRNKDGETLDPCEAMLLQWYTACRKSFEEQRAELKKKFPEKLKAYFELFIDDSVTCGEWAAVTIGATLNKFSVRESGEDGEITPDAEFWQPLQGLICSVGYAAFGRVRRLNFRTEPQQTTPEPRDAAKAGATMFCTLANVARGINGKDMAFKHGLRFLGNARNRKTNAVYLSSPVRNALDWRLVFSKHGYGNGYPFALIKPVPWKERQPGGYLSIPSTLISGRDDDGTQNDARVHSAINILSATPWRINRTIYEVMRRASEKWTDEELRHKAGLPLMGTLPDIPASELSAGSFRNLEHFAAHRTRYRAEMQDHIERFNDWAQRRRSTEMHRAKVERGVFCSKLDTAEKYLDYPKFYIPMRYDFRGRVIPLPYPLNHHADDVARGLLEFADDVPVTDTGMRWIKIHLANLCGQSGTFEERVAWVDKNAKKFKDWADNPEATREQWVNEAGDPWQALAAAIALNNKAAAAHLPVRVDGSASAIQHLGALARDKKIAGLVNVVPTRNMPSDIYFIIRNRVLDDALLRMVNSRVAEESLGALAEAMVRLFDFDRGAFKSIVMPVIYGADVHKKALGLYARFLERRTCVPHIGTYSVNKAGKGFIITSNSSVTLKSLTGEKGNDTAKQVFTRVGERFSIETCEAIVRMAVGKLNDLCHSANQVRAWLKMIGGIKRDKPVSWTSPSGFVVIQDTRKYRKRPPRGFAEVKVFWPEAKSGKAIRVTGDYRLWGIDLNKQASGMSPNVIHSLDGAHVAFAALKCKEKIPLATIHDAFMAHAGNMDALNATPDGILHQTFIDVHNHNILGQIHANLSDDDKKSVIKKIGSAKDKAPQTVRATLDDDGKPPIGDSLKLEEISNAPYLFS